MPVLLTLAGKLHPYTVLTNVHAEGGVSRLINVRHRFHQELKATK